MNDYYFMEALHIPRAGYQPLRPSLFDDEGYVHGGGCHLVMWKWGSWSMLAMQMAVLRVRRKMMTRWRTLRMLNFNGLEGSVAVWCMVSIFSILAVPGCLVAGPHMWPQPYMQSLADAYAVVVPLMLILTKSRTAYAVLIDCTCGLWSDCTSISVD